MIFASYYVNIIIDEKSRCSKCHQQDQGTDGTDGSSGNHTGNGERRRTVVVLVDDVQIKSNNANEINSFSYV